MATYPSDPALAQLVDGVTVIDEDVMNAFVDNINAIGAALADIAAEDGQIHLADDKRIYFDTAEAESMYFDTGNSRFYMSDDLYVSGSLTVVNDVYSTGATLTINDNCDITGALSKGSGSFKIEHPVDPDRHLYHGFIEGPEHGLLYRGRVRLENGKAIINIDIESGMMDGTFDALARNPTIYLQNLSGFTAVRPLEMDGAEFTIVAQDETCCDEISWLVCAERKDKFVMEHETTDDNGHLILEPLKPEEAKC